MVVIIVVIMVVIMVVIIVVITCNVLNIIETILLETLPSHLDNLDIERYQDHSFPTITYAEVI